MTGQHGVRLGRLFSVSVSLLMFVGCAGSDPGGTAGTTGSAGTSGSTGAAGTTTDGGAGTGTAGSSGGSGGGTAGATAGSGGGGAGGMAFSCPAVTTVGTCSAPTDIRCPAPKLSLSGCIDAQPFSDPKIPLKMAANVVPYEVNSPLWSDAAYKTRGVRLPTGGKIHVKDCAANPDECKIDDPLTGKCCAPTADDGKWVLPVGTVLVKNFFFPDTTRSTGMKIVETRLLVRLPKAQLVEGVMSEWIGYGYKWDDAQTDATIIGVSNGTDSAGTDTGVSATFNTTPTKGGAVTQVKWDYPSRIDCITCHVQIKLSATAASTAIPGGYSIGLETVQMNRTPVGEAMNQIDRFNGLNMFEKAPAKPYKAALTAPYMGQAGAPLAAATLDEKARSYLHANCAFCHRPDGKFSTMDLRYDVPFKSTLLCNAEPGARLGDLGVAGAKLLVPKSPMTSVMWLRMHAPAATETNATGRMPQVGTSVIDTNGTDLISQWINSITACPQ
jgi:hypothetical protein